jgi:hypothetical protein
LNSHLQTVERVLLINDDVLRPDEFKASVAHEFVQVVVKLPHVMRVSTDSAIVAETETVLLCFHLEFNY